MRSVLMVLMVSAAKRGMSWKVYKKVGQGGSPVRLFLSRKIRLELVCEVRNRPTNHGCLTVRWKMMCWLVGDLQFQTRIVDRRKTKH